MNETHGGATTALAPTGPPALPEPVQRRGITEAQWRTLANNLFPGAASNSVLMVWDYCAARNLDPMKKPCHIVPMEVKVGEKYEWRDVVMPGIYEYRITAHRTGEYLGHSEPEYGPEKEQFGVTAPEWCRIEVYRWNNTAKMKVPYPVKIYFAEVVATRKDRDTKEVRANARWTRAPRQMLSKCTEAAALREAFPEEIGGEPTAEEMDGQHAISSTAVIDVKPLTALDRIPEGMRDNIERACAELQMTPAQALAKANEFMADGVNAEEGALKLLDWLKHEHESRRSGGPSRRKGSNNGKGGKAESASAGSGADAGSQSPAGGSASTPVGDQPPQTQSTAQSEPPTAELKAAEPVTAGDALF